MNQYSAPLIAAVLGASLLGGCSSDGGSLGTMFTTQSINPQSPQVAVAAAPKIDPACYSLTQRIDVLRKEGVTERMEKASVGKSSTVAVKRASLGQAAELDKANAEFQARCSTLGARPLQAAQTAPIGAPIGNSSQVVSATTPRTTGSIAPPVVQQNQ